MESRGAGCPVHIWASTSRQCSSPLFNASRTPLSGSNRASRAALVQPTPPPPPPLLIHRLPIPTTSSPSASTVIRFITTIAGDQHAKRRRRPAPDKLGTARIHTPPAPCCVSLTPVFLLSSTCVRHLILFFFFAQRLNFSFFFFL